MPMKATFKSTQESLLRYVNKYQFFAIVGFNEAMAFTTMESMADTFPAFTSDGSLMST